MQTSMELVAYSGLVNIHGKIYSLKIRLMLLDVKIGEMSHGRLSDLSKVDFRQRVYEIVASIPEGRVMTYGDIAVLAGQPTMARAVGGIAHFGDTSLPWHRVVNRLGDCASGYYGGKEGHRQVLEAEGFLVENYRISDFNDKRWWPGK